LRTNKLLTDAAEHGCRLANTVLSTTAGLNAAHSTVEYREALIVAFFTAGMVCQSDHASKDEATSFAVAFADQLRAVIKDEALKFT